MNDLDYRVMRNPETLASYRRWLADTWLKGRLLLICATAAFAVATLIATRALRLGDHSTLGYAGGALSLAGGLTMLAVGRVQMYRRRHPWVDPADT